MRFTWKRKDTHSSVYKDKFTNSKAHNTVSQYDRCKNESYSHIKRGPCCEKSCLNIVELRPWLKRPCCGQQLVDCKNSCYTSAVNA